MRRPIRLSRIWAPWTPMLVLADFLIVLLSAHVSAWVLAVAFGRDGLWPLWRSWETLAVVMALVFPLALQALGLYQPRLQPFAIREALRKVATWLALLVVLGLVMFATKSGAGYSRLWVASWFSMVALFLVLEMSLFHQLAKRLRRRGLGVRRVLIVGSGSLAVRVESMLRDNPGVGLDVLGYLSEDDVDVMPSRARRLGGINDLDHVLRGAEADGVDEVWLTLPLTKQQRIREVLKNSRENLIDVRMVPDIFVYDLLNRDVDEIIGLPIIGLSTTPHVGLDLALKRGMDICGALVALLLFAPIMLVSALIIAWTSPGGVIFRQPRHGLDGQTFMALKFRTMRADLPDAGRFRQAQRNDPRITPVGRVLRRLSLDELPQLLNVLVGDMSLVGPRPHPVDMNMTHWNDIDRYALRHRVKPGITGWAQVHGLRGETRDVQLLRKRIEYDLFYIENWSLVLDVKILLRTLVVAWGQANAY